MKIGLIARGEDRGLGNLTREWARHMDPVRTLLIRPQAAVDAQLAQHCAWFDPDALRATFAGELDEQLMRRFLQGLDVVYSAETFYDWRMCDIARELGVRTVCHAMPEYWKHTPNPTNRFHDPAPPDVWWVPTRWRLDHLPEQTRVVPVPVPLDRFEQVPRTTAENTAIRWLHVVGSRAHADRNGTRIFIGALQHLRGEHVVELRSQGETFYAPRVGRKVHVIVKTAEVEDYWRLYDDADALVLPRRYGGLCLPAIEGMGAGLALVMPDVEPQRSEWPIITIPAEFKNRITTSAGNIPICAPDERELAQTMNWHAMHPGALRDRQSESLRWARMHSWAAQQVVIEGELERALA